MHLLILTTFWVWILIVKVFEIFRSIQSPGLGFRLSLMSVLPAKAGI